MDVDSAIKLIEEITQTPACKISAIKDIRAGQEYIYLVANRPHILQIGKSEGKTSSRLRSLMKGAKPGMHNKSFIVGLAPEAFGNENEVYYFKTLRADEKEVNIHRKLGIRTNKDPCVFFDGIRPKNIDEAQATVFEKFKQRKSNSYSAAEFAEFENVLKLVQRGVKFERRGKPAEYHSGDCLNGSVLRGAGLLGMAKIWQKMTNEYFVYSDRYLDGNNESIEPSVAFEIAASAACHVDLLEIDLLLYRIQFESALDYLKKHFITPYDVNLYFETSNSHYILELEHIESIDKISLIIESFKGSEEITLSNLERSGHKTKIQYCSYWSSCYVVHRARGFQAKGPKYFSLP